jgi:hypothetical protein
VKAAHFEHSSLRERIVEHIFVGETLKRLWVRGVMDVEVLRSEFDAHGYDLILSRGHLVRHIQFKTGTQNRPLKVSVSSGLADKPSGCIIWIKVDDDLEMGPYFWFGSSPGKPLPDVSAYPFPKRPTHNSKGKRPERKNHRLIPGRDFKMIQDLDGLLGALLGDLASPMAGDLALLTSAGQEIAG